MKTVPALVSSSGPSGGSIYASNGHDRHRVAIVPVVSRTEAPAATSDDTDTQLGLDANDERLIEMPETEMDEFDAFEEQIPMTALATTSSSTPPNTPTLQLEKSAPRRRKYLALISTCFVLLLLAGLGTTFVLRGRDAGPDSSTIQRHSSQVKQSSNVSPTQIPGASIYPSLASSYTGTVADLMTQEKTPLRLTNIQQNQESIQGFCRGLGLTGSFTGTVTPSGQVRFIVTLYGGAESLLFEGTIKVGGDVVGTFTVLNQQGHKTGESGLWNVAASS